DLAVALVPWHPALHWQRRRLRLAVELDCDARVLRSSGDTRAYAELLLDVARRPRVVRNRLVGAVALAPRHSTLERRITAMTEIRPRRPLAALTLACGAGMLVLVACEAPRPTAPLPAHEVPLAELAREAKGAPDDTVVTIHSGSVLYSSSDATGGETARVRLVRDSLVAMRSRGELPEGEPVVAVHDLDGVVLRTTSELQALGIEPGSIDRIEVVKGAA